MPLTGGRRSAYRDGLALGQTYQAVLEIFKSARTADPNDPSNSIGCKVAQACWSDARTERRIWGALLLFVGIAAAITVTTMVLQLRDLNTNLDKLKAAGLVGGALLSTGIGAWLVKRVNDARADVEKWANLVRERCDKPAGSAAA